VVVDVERGRTVKGWKPRRLGGGLGATRKGGDSVNVKYSGREDGDRWVVVAAGRRRRRKRRSGNLMMVMVCCCSCRGRERDRGDDASRVSYDSRDRDRDRGRDRSVVIVMVLVLVILLLFDPTLFLCVCVVAAGDHGAALGNDVMTGEAYGSPYGIHAPISHQSADRSLHNVRTLLCS